jgi:hypothetical protein
MALFMRQYLIVLYTHPRAVLVKTAFDGILKSFLIVTEFDIDIAAGKRGVG